jgi:hypothetical protein
LVAGSFFLKKYSPPKLTGNVTPATLPINAVRTRLFPVFSWLTFMAPALLPLLVSPLVLFTSFTSLPVYYLC